MTKRDECVILFSGGTDSMLAAALQQERFRKIYLVTYDRFGLYATENTKINAKLLRDKYGADRVEHRIINIDNLFRYVSYERYWHNLFKHRFMVLSTCGLCKLAMHVRTVKFCQDLGITHVSDGANQGMNMFPDQMPGVIAELQKMYRHFGIEYSNPVFAHSPPEEGNFIKMDNLNMLSSLANQGQEDDSAAARKRREGTTGYALYQKGLAPLPNVKGTPYDRQRQPRCFQFMLFKIFVNKYFLEKYTHEEYIRRTHKFFAEKIHKMIELLGPDAEKLNRIIER
jgi:hypothetical protein